MRITDSDTGQYDLVSCPKCTGSGVILPSDYVQKEVITKQNLDRAIDIAVQSVEKALGKT